MTDQELHKQLERESTVRHLYNPGNKWLDGRHNAHPYPLCPDGEAVNASTGQVETTDGVTAIPDRWGAEWVGGRDEDGPQRQTGNRVLYASSIAIVKHLLKSYPFVRLLTGDPKRDEVIKAEARQTWVKHRLKWAGEVIANRDAYLREFHASPSNAGQLPTPPNGLELEAMEFMAEYRLGNIGRKAFACQHDGYQTDDARKWASHQKAFHPADAEKEAKDAKDAALEAGAGKGKGPRARS